MCTENYTFLQDEDENVVLEGSELHRALINIGYNNFDSIPRVKKENISFESNLSTIHNYQTLTQNFCNKINLIYKYIFEEKILNEDQLQIILKSKILLDDHALMIHGFVTEQQSSICFYKKVLEWVPIIGTTMIASFQTLFMRKKSVPFALSIYVFLGLFIYAKSKKWAIIRKLKNFVSLQNEFHNLVKQILKILRRTFGKKSVIEIKDQDKLLGTKRLNIINTMTQLLTEFFENLTYLYYHQASEILNFLPNHIKLNCILTKIQVEDKTDYDERNYDKLRSLYYIFILVQSELMVIVASACDVKSEYESYKILKLKICQVINNLTKGLSRYYSKLSKMMYSYKLSEIKPVQRIFKGVQNKWQDTYIHLDLTSQRIQLAYKQIVSILELMDTHSDIDEGSSELMESILEKMNEAYKEIENARSFAEFSSLLIAKAQCKSTTNYDSANKEKNLSPLNGDNRTVIVIDKDPVIEDEVFEEYIKEEYLKPLYENSDESVVQNLKLDKLLAKNFMSELKEALLEKQRTMNERELKALKRMYNRVLADSSVDKTEISKSLSNTDIFDPTLNLVKSSLKSLVPPQMPLQCPTSSHILPMPPPPPPPPPPTILTDAIIVECTVQNEIKTKNHRTPIPLPRVKMFDPKDDLSNIQRFSISECKPHFQFPQFKVVEETFLGSGENSEDDLENENDFVVEAEFMKES